MTVQSAHGKQQLLACTVQSTAISLHILTEERSLHQRTAATEVISCNFGSQVNALKPWELCFVTDQPTVPTNVSATRCLSAGRSCARGRTGLSIPLHRPQAKAVDGVNTCLSMDRHTCKQRAVIGMRVSSDCAWGVAGAGVGGIPAASPCHRGLVRLRPRCDRSVQRLRCQHRPSRSRHRG